MLPAYPWGNQLISPELTQRFLCCAPVAIAMLDSDLQYLIVSKRWLDDDCSDNLTGQSHLDKVGHQAGEWQFIYQRCLREGIEVCREEFTEVSPKATGWLKWKIAPWRDQDNAVGGLFVIREDITEQKRAEASRSGQSCSSSLETALAQSEAKFQRMVEAANDLIYMIGLDGSFTYLSPQFKAMWGYELEEFADKSFAEIVHPEDLQRVMTSAQHVMQTGQQDYGLEFRTQRKDGSWGWIVCNSSPMFDAEGHPIGLQGIARDVSDRQKTEEALRASELALRQKAEDLEITLQKLQQTQSKLLQGEKMSSLGQLVAGVAHEINNPINFINGNLNHAKTYVQDLLGLLSLYQTHYPTPVPDIQAKIEAIELDFMVEDLNKLLTSMKVGVDRISQIVLSLRNFSRMDEADLKTVNLQEGIESTLMILAHRLKANPKRPAIQVHKDYSDLPLVDCFPGQLNQVFMNILVNAIDALEEQESKRTGPASVPSQIQIRTEVSSDQHACITVIDNGPGMSEAVRERLFDPFFTTKPVGKGTGMGLSISYQIIVEQHNGNLVCKPHAAGGTEFVVTIPLKQAQS
jgi:PAS domain S-box-containing protein